MPFLSCRKGSRGAPEEWPYSKKPKSSSWSFEAHGIYNKAGSAAVAKVEIDAASTVRLSAEGASKTDDLADMDWTAGRRRIDIKQAEKI